MSPTFHLLLQSSKQMSQPEAAEKITPTSPSSIATREANNKNPPIVISVSPSTLVLSLVSFSLISLSLLFLSFNGTTFWFFISNAIILFIAAIDDAGNSSPSKYRLDLYDQYMKSGGSRTSLGDAKKIEPQFFTLAAEENSNKVVLKKPPREKYQRSETSKAIVVVGRKRKELQRSATDIVGSSSSSSSGNGLQEDEFSAMSDEELNRRVEEFIRKINRQIRLQEVNDEQIIQSL